MWDSLQSFLNYLAALVLVIVLAYVAIRFGAHMMNPGSNRGVTKVIERIPLDIRRGHILYLVQAGTRYLLIGVSQGNIALIKELLPEDVEIEEEEQGDRTEDKRSFKEILSAFTNNSRK